MPGTVHSPKLRRQPFGAIGLSPCRAAPARPFRVRSGMSRRAGQSPAGQHGLSITRGAASAPRRHACVPHLARDGTVPRLAEIREGLKPWLPKSVEGNDMQRIRPIEKSSLLLRADSTRPTKRKSRNENGGGERRIRNIEKKRLSASARRRSSRMGGPSSNIIACWRSKMASANSAGSDPEKGRYAPIIVTRGSRSALSFAPTATACSAFPETTRIVWKREPGFCASSSGMKARGLQRPQRSTSGPCRHVRPACNRRCNDRRRKSKRLAPRNDRRGDVSARSRSVPRRLGWLLRCCIPATAGRSLLQIIRNCICLL
jgi:hypothetical protein